MKSFALGAFLMIRFHHLMTSILVVSLCAVAMESELPQRLAARLGVWPETMRPTRNVDIVAAELQKIYPTHNADVVMLGDSLTAEAEWRELLPGRDVVNRGVAGQTVEEIVGRADDIVRLHPRIIFVMAGANDLMTGKTPDDTVTIYEHLLDRLKPSGATIIVQSVLYVGRDRNFLGLQRFWYNRRNDKISELNQRLRDLTVARGATFLDINEILAPGGVLPDGATSDGTHLRAASYITWAGTIEKVLVDLDADRDYGSARDKAVRTRY